MLPAGIACAVTAMVLPCRASDPYAVFPWKPAPNPCGCGHAVSSLDGVVANQRQSAFDDTWNGRIDLVDICGLVVFPGVSSTRYCCRQASTSAEEGP